MEVDRIYGFGANFAGQLGTGDTEPTNEKKPFVLIGKETFDSLHVTKILDIATGGSHNVILVATDREEKLNICFGGQDGPKKPRVVGLLRQSNIIAVACGGSNSIVLDFYKNAFEWGFDPNDKTAISQPQNLTKLPINRLIAQVSCGGAHSLALSDRSVYGKGSNSCGQLGGEEEVYPTFKILELNFSRQVTAVAAGGRFSLFKLSNNLLFALGDNERGQCGVGDSNTKKIRKPVEVQLDAIKNSSVDQFGCGDKSAFIIDNNGNFYLWGSNHSGELGLGDNQNRLTPTNVPFSGLVTSAAMGGGFQQAHTVVVLANETVYASGSSKYFQTGFSEDKNTFEEILFLRNKRCSKVHCGWLHTFVLGKGIAEFPPLVQSDLFMGKFQAIPQDIIVHHILTALGGKGLSRLSRVNSIFNSLCNHNFLWKAALYKDFGIISQQSSAKFEYQIQVQKTKKAFGFSLLGKTESKKGPSPFAKTTLLGQVMSWFSPVSRKEYRMLMVGLDAAGKTTILYRMKLGEVVTTIPTIGFNVETVERNGLSITVWDVGGPDKIRPLWRHYMQDTKGVIFVIDSNDRDRIGEASQELRAMLRETELVDAHLLVLANKQDLPNAMSCSQITEALGLNSVRDRNWYIQSCCATQAEGLFEGFDWLAKSIDRSEK